MKKILLFLVLAMTFIASAFAVSPINCATYDDVTFTNITNQTTYDSGNCFHMGNPLESLYFNETDFNASVVSCSLSTDNTTIDCSPVANGTTTLYALVTNGSDTTLFSANMIVAIPPVTSTPTITPLSCTNDTVIQLTHPNGNTTETIYPTTTCSQVTNHTFSNVVVSNASKLVVSSNNTAIEAVATATGIVEVTFTVSNEEESKDVLVTYNISQYTTPSAPLEVCGDLDVQNLTHPNGNTTWKMNATQMCSGTSYTISQVEIDNNSMAFCQTEDSNSAVSCLATQIGTFTLNYTVTGVSIEKNYSVIFDVTNYTSSVSTVVATESCLDFTQQNLTHPDGNTTWLRNTTQFCTGGNFTVSNVVFDNLSMAFCQTENNDSAVSCLATQTGNFTLNFTVSGSTLEKNYSIPFVVTNFTQTSVTNNAPVCGTTSYSLTNPDGNTTFNHTITSTCTDVDYDNVTIIDFTNSYSTVSCSVSSDNVTLTCSSTATGNEVIYYTVTDGQVNTTGNISVSVTSFTESTSSGSTTSSSSSNGRNRRSSSGSGIYVGTSSNTTQTNTSSSDDDENTQTNQTSIITNEDVSNDETIEVIGQPDQIQTTDGNQITGQFLGENSTGIIIGITVLVLALLSAIALFVINANKKK